MKFIINHWELFLGIVGIIIAVVATTFWHRFKFREEQEKQLYNVLVDFCTYDKFGAMINHLITARIERGKELSEIIWNVFHQKYVDVFSEKLDNAKDFAGLLAIMKRLSAVYTEEKNFVIQDKLFSLFREISIKNAHNLVRVLNQNPEYDNMSLSDIVGMYKGLFSTDSRFPRDPNFDALYWIFAENRENKEITSALDKRIKMEIESRDVIPMFADPEDKDNDEFSNLHYLYLKVVDEEVKTLIRGILVSAKNYYLQNLEDEHIGLIFTARYNLLRPIRELFAEPV